MPTETPVAVVTGASGYLGSRICSTLESRGWQVIRLVRSPGHNHSAELSYHLAEPITDGVRQALRSADVLIHAAYDLSSTSPVDIWRVNVEGARRLLEEATEAAVGRIIVISSMSAFGGTSQLYGRAKLDIEAMTKEFGGCAIRPGLVYGAGSGGMAGALRRLTTLPIVPVIAGGAGVYTVREDDLMMAIYALTSASTLAPGTISIAHPSRVTLTDLLKVFAAQEGHRCRFVPVPWKLVYWLLRSGEFSRLHLPFRADSLLGLVHTTPSLSGGDQLDKLGVTLQAFRLPTAAETAAPAIPVTIAAHRHRRNFSTLRGNPARTSVRMYNDMVTAISPKVSVIIPAYTMKRWELMQQAVASACNQTSPPLEVIVPIDNNEELLRIAQSKWPMTRTDTDVPVRVIASKFPHEERSLSVHARAHGDKRRFGAGEARNTAAEQAEGEILAFLDDDAAAEVTWIEELLKPYIDQSVLAVGGAPYPRYEAERPLWFPRQFDWVFGCAYEGLPTTTSPFLRLIGANMSVRADVLKQIGGFHSIDFDDMDMCHRVAALGGPTSVVFTPSAVVRHYVPAQRTSWNYFWTRCFYVNREKVRAHREMGSASSFRPDVTFVVRTITMGIFRELRSALRGDRYAILRIGAILVGVASAAVGNAVGRASATWQE